MKDGEAKSLMLNNAHSVAARVLWSGGLLTSDRYFFDVMITAFEREDPDGEMCFRLARVGDWLRDGRADEFRNRVKFEQTSRQTYPCGVLYTDAVFPWMTPEPGFESHIDPGRWNWWRERYFKLAEDQAAAAGGTESFREDARMLQEIDHIFGVNSG